MRCLAVAAAACIAFSPSALSEDRSRPRVETLQGVPRAVRGCWRVPDGLRRFERVEATLRFSLKADGSLLGAGRIAYTNLPQGSRARELLVGSLAAALADCLPLDLSPGLGQAVAGRLLAVRFVYVGARGRAA